MNKIGKNMNKLLIQSCLMFFCWCGTCSALTLNIQLTTANNDIGDPYAIQNFLYSGAIITEIPVDADGTEDWFSILDLVLTNNDILNSISYQYNASVDRPIGVPSLDVHGSTVSGILKPGESITVPRFITASNWEHIKFTSSAPSAPGGSIILTDRNDNGDCIYHLICAVNGFSFYGEDWFGIAGIGAIVVSGQTHVPEPATMLLFGTGIAGLAAVGRRKRSKFIFH